MPQLLLVGAGGCLGAMARFLLAGAVQRRFIDRFPAGTLVVNLLGCLLIGALTALARGKGLIGARQHAFLVAGILGGFTTFSAFGQETLDLLSGDRFAAAALNAGLSVGLGVAAAAAGRALCA